MALLSYYERMVIRLLISALLVSALSGCVPVAIGAGAMAGMAAGKENGISGEVDDARISAAINDAWYRKDVEMFRKLNLTVENGEVLITGVVQNPEHRIEAVRIAWQVEGVTKVINEIQVTGSEGVGGYLKDTWIGTQLRAKLTASPDVHALNYTIEVVRGVVYIMGVARSQNELNEVVDIARNINYVQNVVSYVRVSVEQAPVIQGATGEITTSPTGGSSSVSSYPLGSQNNAGVIGGDTQAQPKPGVGMKPIVEGSSF